MGGPDAVVRSMRYTSDVDAEASSPTGSVADAAPIFLFRDGVERANPRRNRQSAWRTGSLLSESSAPPRLAEQPAPGVSLRGSQGVELTLCREGVNRRSTSCVRGAMSHVRATVARLSGDLLALEIASPGSGGRQRRGQVSGRLTP